ncbi:hypothetical protein Q8A67_017895 [Cirrhinus molitorella]|uniref:Uncharacterized protein n=1 Tax=Cirrhinus molitorella TaxID=172907 RepID=A0AA88THJ7_9TELE|nr:hypothetical protein Q8A67_017895 [Cirrhinus molitorella]
MMSSSRWRCVNLVLNVHSLNKRQSGSYRNKQQRTTKLGAEINISDRIIIEKAPEEAAELCCAASFSLLHSHTDSWRRCLSQDRLNSLPPAFEV